ncbi:MAG TPA: hypothetical protein DCY35_04250 [Prolixibacteraceae bacterium]|nr:hypothetical protein [Prolixibacteraceae bacterium]
MISRNDGIHVCLERDRLAKGTECACGGNNQKGNDVLHKHLYDRDFGIDMHGLPPMLKSDTLFFLYRKKMYKG